MTTHVLINTLVGTSNVLTTSIIIELISSMKMSVVKTLHVSLMSNLKAIKIEPFKKVK